jgi:hypothetical protein
MRDTAGREQSRPGIGGLSRKRSRGPSATPGPGPYCRHGRPFTRPACDGATRLVRRADRGIDRCGASDVLHARGDGRQRCRRPRRLSAAPDRRRAPVCPSAACTCVLGWLCRRAGHRHRFAALGTPAGHGATRRVATATSDEADSGALSGASAAAALCDALGEDDRRLAARQPYRPRANATLGANTVRFSSGDAIGLRRRMSAACAQVGSALGGQA